MRRFQPFSLKQLGREGVDAHSAQDRTGPLAESLIIRPNRDRSFRTDDIPPRCMPPVGTCIEIACPLITDVVAMPGLCS